MFLVQSGTPLIQFRGAPMRFLNEILERLVAYGQKFNLKQSHSWLSTQLELSHTSASYLCQELSLLCKFLKSALNKLQVQAGALAGGSEVSFFSVRQKLSVSATIQCWQTTNAIDDHVTSSTVDPGSTDSNRKRSKTRFGFLCWSSFKKNKQNKTTNEIPELCYIMCTLEL